ncbi:MAG TPA: hypothetical protein VJP85_10985 [Candidatus Baltobacteraceae bacterium]|nr:hypothetical protein [Candidatus Baltobacteraceae bacterium]
MRHLIRPLAAAFGLLLPAAAPAISATQPASYDTALTAVYGSPSPYTGTLRLTVSSSGIVRGYYFSSDGTAMFVPVTGGKNGDSIWFDIGDGRMYHVDGRVEDGTIVGTAFTGANEPYTFVARPER